MPEFPESLLRKKRFVTKGQRAKLYLQRYLVQHVEPTVAIHYSPNVTLFGTSTVPVTGLPIIFTEHLALDRRQTCVVYHLLEFVVLDGDQPRDPDLPILSKNKPYMHSSFLLLYLQFSNCLK